VRAIAGHDSGLEMLTTRQAVHATQVMAEAAVRSPVVYGVEPSYRMMRFASRRRRFFPTMRRRRAAAVWGWARGGANAPLRVADPLGRS